jgi:predicted nuclease with RNAse H fold
VGIDVGGPRKGFHAIALRGGAYAGRLASCEAQELARWCRSVVHARVIAIDAPCRWSTDGRARPGERELMQKGIWCFSSPTHQQAHTPHRTGYFNWMLQGEKLYQALEASHPLVCRLPIAGPGCFETFPHAITWHLCGGKAKAAQKRTQRRELLQQAGIDLAPLTAQIAAAGGECVHYGEPETGWIVVPRGPARAGQLWGMNGPHCLP